MRMFVGAGTEESREILGHLHQEFGKGSWYLCWDRRCLIPVPQPGTKFEVVEPLEICNSVNEHSGEELPVGRYEVVEMRGGYTSHTLRLKNIDTGEEVPEPIHIGYTDESQMDWRGIRKVV